MLQLAEKWEINGAVVGTVRSGGTLNVRHGGELVAELPAASLSEDAPLYHRPYEQPTWMDRLWADAPVLPAGVDAGDVLLRLLDDPAIGDRSWIYEQYDHQLFLNTVVEPGHDGSLMRVKGTTKGLAVSTDGNGRLCYLDPRRGSARIVYESALNVAVTGTRPYALVDNMNFGNPEKPDVMWQFVEAVEGISEACEALGIPVVGGNVSFYNETDGVDIFPSPVVGMLGFTEEMPEHPPRLDRAEAGMGIWLVGADTRRDFAASAYTRVVLDHFGGRPIDVDHEQAPRVVAAATTLAYDHPVLHDVSLGGVAVALAEIAIVSEIGFELEVRDWHHLFSEAPHRFLVVSHDEPDTGDVAKWRLGTVGGDQLDFGRHGTVSLDEAAHVWRHALPRRLG